jgi:hypothetical protein
MPNHISQLNQFSSKVESLQIKQQLSLLIFLFILKTETIIENRRKGAKKNTLISY